MSLHSERMSLRAGPDWWVHTPAAFQLLPNGRSLLTYFDPMVVALWRTLGPNLGSREPSPH